QMPVAIRCLRTLGWLGGHRHHHLRLRESWLWSTRRLEDGRDLQIMFFIHWRKRRTFLPVTPATGRTRRREARVCSTILLPEIPMSPVNQDSAELWALIWRPDWAPWMPTIWLMHGPLRPARSRELSRALRLPWALLLISRTANLSR